MGSDTENAIDTLFDTILDRIQQEVKKKQYLTMIIIFKML